MKTKHIKHLILGITLSGAVCADAANLILNGSFESTTATPGNHYNYSNEGLTATIADVTGFGVPGEIDYLYTGTAYGINPQDGNWALAIASPGGGSTSADAFSFTLASSLTVGASYQLDFRVHNIYNGGGSLLIGISTSATSFGTLIFSALPQTSGWAEFSTTFVAPSSGAFLTVQQGVGSSTTWNETDNFSLTTASVPEPGMLSLLGSMAGVALLRRRRG